MGLIVKELILMKQVYPTFIAQNGNDFLVYVPDLDIYTEGTSFVNAIEMARDAIGLKAIDIEDEGQEPPAPSSPNKALQKAKADADIFDYSTGILTFVDIDFTEYRKQVATAAVNRIITLPQWLDYEANKAALNLSAITQNALIEKLNAQQTR